MAKYKVSGIVYCIEPEDVGLNEDDFALRSDYLKACDDEIDGILEELPSELIIDLGDDSDGDLEDDLAEAISDETGWLIEGFNYEELGTDDPQHAQIMSKPEYEEDAR